MTIPFILKKHKSATVENATKISELSSEQIDKISGVGPGDDCGCSYHATVKITGGVPNDVQTDGASGEASYGGYVSSKF